MRRLAAIVDGLSGWWRAWVAALGGANQQMMCEAYRDAHEPREKASAGDDDGGVEKRVH